MKIVLLFIKGRRGDTISRLPNGKVVLVNKNYKGLPKPGEKWLCRIDKEFERFAVVTPIEKVVKKEQRFYRIYKCGHKVLVRTDIIEVPESQEVNDIVKLWNYEVCRECKKRCKHRELRISHGSFSVAVVCSDCDKTLWSKEMEMTIESYEATREELIRRFPQLAEEAKEVFEEKIQWLKEYKEKSEEYKRLQKKIGKLVEEIKEHMKQFIEPKYIEFAEKHRIPLIDFRNNSVAVFSGMAETVIGAIGPRYVETSAIEVYRTIPREQLPPRVQELLRELEETEKQRDRVHWWLIENRPIE